MTIASISIIGSGRVATQLALGLASHTQIKQIYSAHIENAAKLAQSVNANAISNLNELNKVDVVFIAVSDSAIAEIAASLRQIGYEGLVVHTSGSTSLEVLTQHHLRAGVFYPLQTFSFDTDVTWQNIPLFIEAVSEKDLAILDEIAQWLSPRVYHYDSKQRLSLHLAAVFACNFSNYCYDIAQQILEQQQVDFSLLMPLIKETTQKLEHFPAVQNQTGPARRNDQNILQMHQQLLAKQPSWQNIYAVLSQAIIERHFGK